MDIKAFSFNSQAKYRTGGHFKQKTVLSLANQEIMADSHGNHFKAMFPDIFADYQSRKENPQKLTQLSSRSHPKHLVGKRTALSWINHDFIVMFLLSINNINLFLVF